MSERSARLSGSAAKSPCSAPSTAMVPEPACELGLEPGQPRAGVGRLVVDAALEARQHLLAHRLGLLDRLRLGRPEQRLRQRRAGERRRGRRAERAGAQAVSDEGHGSLPSSSTLPSARRRRPVAAARHQPRPDQPGLGRRRRRASSARTSMSGDARRRSRGSRASKVVRPGGASAAAGTSSKPMTERSSGTRRPSARRLLHHRRAPARRRARAPRSAGPAGRAARGSRRRGAAWSKRGAATVSSRTAGSPRRAIACAQALGAQPPEGHRLGDGDEAEMPVAEPVEQVEGLGEGRLRRRCRSRSGARPGISVRPCETKGKPRASEVGDARDRPR